MEEIALRHAAETVFTRFIPPRSPTEAVGAWRPFFERWRDFTLDCVDPALLRLTEPLSKLTPPAVVLDKPGFSPFHRSELHGFLQARKVDTLVITGAETDVCVLAAVLSAIDLGYLVILPKDALCGSADETHDALMRVYESRFSQQVVVSDAVSVLEAWPEQGPVRRNRLA
ncbi:MAG TPA: cysteine hydrolase [Hansschlegelia sp.]